MNTWRAGSLCSDDAAEGPQGFVHALNAWHSDAAVYAPSVEGVAALCTLNACQGCCSVHHERFVGKGRGVAHC